MPAETLEMALRELCLTAIAPRIGQLLQIAEAQNWGYRKLLLHLCESELAERR